MGLSFFTFLIAYIMVANTTRNTLSTAMPMAAHGRWKEVSYGHLIDLTVEDAQLALRIAVKID